MFLRGDLADAIGIAPGSRLTGTLPLRERVETIGWVGVEVVFPIRANSRELARVRVNGLAGVGLVGPDVGDPWHAPRATTPFIASVGASGGVRDEMGQTTGRGSASAQTESGNERPWRMGEWG